ncbi:MAG: hypothetical protein ACRC0L_10050, partial [Angustibacter sp.]
MRFSFTASDGRSGEPQDLMVDLDQDQPISELLPVLLAALNPDVHPSFAARVPLWIDGRPVDPASTVRQAGLRSGAQVELHQSR